MSHRAERTGWTWWDRVLVWVPFFVGVGLLIWGDSVDRIFAAGMVGVPTAAYGWATWKFLLARRAARRDQSVSS